MFLPRVRVILALSFVSGTAGAGDTPSERVPPGDPQGLFHHVGTFDVTRNGTEVAEIVAATTGGRRLIYTDSATGAIGFVDITNPENPRPEGALVIGGSPTSVAIVSGWALVAVDTSPDFVSPSGELVVVDTTTRLVAARLPLGGQPDAVSISPDGTLAAVIIENQRDEDLADGLLPQLPGGELAIVDLIGDPAQWTVRHVALDGLSAIAPTDPEPEFVDINTRGEAIVTLQENNHLVLVDLIAGTVIDDFPAGTVELHHVDANEEDVVHLTDTLTRRREPDGVVWLTDDRFATANEGDYEDEQGEVGGSRGFTLFDRDGTVAFESAETFEHAAVRVGHYPEGRSENKGVEAEAVEVGVFGNRTLLFVGAERANAVGVYDVSGGDPVLLQVLPTGIGPEGVKAIGRRNLLVVASETADDGVPSMITVYRTESGPPPYPGIESADDADGLPIPWTALSGLAGDPDDADRMVAVNDSALGEGFVYTIDVSTAPATITSRIQVTGLSFDADLEGIAVAPEGGYWLASEGEVDERPNTIVHVDADGVVTAEIPLPDSLAEGMTDDGLEGVAAVGGTVTAYVYTVVAGEWADDPAGQVKVARYDVAAGTWGFVSYPVDGSPNGGTVGPSEITALPDGTLAILERDDQSGTNARIKRVYTIDPYAVTFRPHGDVLDVAVKTRVADLLRDLGSHSVWTPERVDGLGVTADDRVFVVTDNGGTDDTLGETVFRNVGVLP